MNPQAEGNSEHIIATLKSEKEELEASLNKEKMQTLQLRQELAEGESRNTDLYKVNNIITFLELKPT